jgi:hypothetical protein
VAASRTRSAKLCSENSRRWRESRTLSLSLLAGGSRLVSDSLPVTWGLRFCEEHNTFRTVVGKPLFVVTAYSVLRTQPSPRRSTPAPSRLPESALSCLTHPSAMA